jgi:hypothetical protein
MFFSQRCNMIEKPASYLQTLINTKIKIIKMKKTILIAALGLSLFSSAFAASPVSSTDRAAAAFKKDFHRTYDVQWSQTESFVIARFSQESETMYAYYDFQGNLIGVVQHILTTSLPESLRDDIKTKYAGYWVSELFQATNENGTYYYVQLKNADETIVLSTEGTPGWHRYFVPAAKNCTNL